MLYLFGCGALGKEANPHNCVEIKKIREAALSQGVWQVVYLPIRKLIQENKVKLPPEIYQILENKFQASVALNIQKTAFCEGIVRKLEAEGIECCILKGHTVGRYYSEPESRESSDFDVYIDACHEKRALKILSDNGFIVHERLKNSNAAKAAHPIGGLLELHVVLNSVDVDAAFFKNTIKPQEKYEKTESGLNTLGVNDCAVYLSVHLIKHFLREGAGVRQMMDLLLFLQARKEDIDWNKYVGFLKETNFFKLIQTTMLIGNKYWGMDFDICDNDEGAMEALLEDVFIGGVFGKEEKGRLSVYKDIVRLKNSMSEAQANEFTRKYVNKTTFEKVFASKKELEKRFKYVKGRVWLLPVAHVHRWWEILMKVIFKKASVKKLIYESSGSASDLVKERRLKLLETLEVIQKR